MSLLDVLRKFMKNLYKSNTSTVFTTDYENQKEYLYSLRNPENNIERSLYQYRCQMKNVSFKVKLLQNIGSLFLLPYFLIKPFSKKEYLYASGSKAIFLCEGVTQNIIPEVLSNEYSEIIESSYKEKVTLDMKDKRFILENFSKYWYLPFFCLKNIMKIGLYSSLINKYNPKAIIVHNEYSFTSSLLTEYCEWRGIEHINVMHGEKLFNIRDSFVRYGRFYVWDIYYIDLFIKLRAPKEQFRIAIPESIKINIPFQEKKKYEYTYYLGFEGEKDLINIRGNLKKLNVALKRICIRYHPRYSDQKLIGKLFSEFSLENPIEIPLNISLSNTNHVISLYSTVLYQAHQNEIAVIIDDVSMPEKFNELKKLKYIMLKKESQYLSEI